MTQETMNEVLKFRDDRAWKQFHNPKDLAISISLEEQNCLNNSSGVQEMWFVKKSWIK